MKLSKIIMTLISIFYEMSSRYYKTDLGQFIAFLLCFSAGVTTLSVIIWLIIG